MFMNDKGEEISDLLVYTLPLCGMFEKSKSKSTVLLTADEDVPHLFQFFMPFDSLGIFASQKSFHSAKKAT